ncbi:MAG: ketopantoate reductase family protein [Steroidobacteraceae bacterium]
MAEFRIAVVGAGGVGGYFAGVLARSGAWVGLLARGDQLAAIGRDGLQVLTPESEFTVKPARVTSDPVAIGPVNAVLVAVKAWQVAEAAELIRPLLGDASRVLPMQNGIEAPSILRRTLRPELVLDGVCRIVSEVVAPGIFRHVGVQPTVHFGEANGGKLSATSVALRDALIAAGVTVHAPVDTRVALWEKLHFLASLSAVAAVARVPVGGIRGSAATRGLVLQAMREVEAVAASAGAPLPEEAVARSVAMFENMPAESTVSMQRDMAAGRPSELDAIVGVVVRLGHEHRVPTPVMETLNAVLLPQEELARSLRG